MTGGWRWQRRAVPVMQRDHLVYEVAEFPENGDLVAAVATTELKSRATANVTLVFVRPEDPTGGWSLVSGYHRPRRRNTVHQQALREHPRYPF